MSYKFKDHKKVHEYIKNSQNADHDNREQVRETHLFLNKRDGQWEPYWWDANKGKPRYTFDLSNPVVDAIAGEMEQANFGIDVSPSGGEATKDIALTYDGLIRNIQNLSNAVHVFNQAGRQMVATGMDGWRVVQKFVDGDVFDQDLLIEKVANFVDRVWFDDAAENQDKSDAMWGTCFHAFSKEEFKKKFPKADDVSVSSDRQADAYWYQPNVVMVAEFYYIIVEERELALMSNGAVYEVDEEYEQVVAELAQMQITEVDRRMREHNVVYERKLGVDGWLSKPMKTVFSYIPIIPTYGNFKIIENKTIYWGAVEKIIDAQRVLNYSMSREIEEGALAPRAKYWMTEKQALGHEDSLETLNLNSEPVQLYNPDPEAPQVPVQQGGAIINAGLRTISEAMSGQINQSASLFMANQGEAQSFAQSGVALKALQTKGDIGSIKYFKSQEVAICHTARILIAAIPKVYNNERTVRILNEDGSYDMTILNQQVPDMETGQNVTLNDLSMGTYDVTCSSGTSFQNRQQEAVAAIVEMAQVDPSIIEMGGDILLNNIDAVGMSALADRKRQQLFNAGVIPVDQMNEQELAEMEQKAQEPPPPDPMMIAAQAEMKKADADMQKAENEKEKIGLQAQGKGGDLQIANMREETARMGLQMKAMNDQRTQEMAQNKFMLEQMTQMVESLNTNADTLRLIREAIGAEAIMAPAAIQAFNSQAQLVQESQP